MSHLIFPCESLDVALLYSWCPEHFTPTQGSSCNSTGRATACFRRRAQECFKESCQLSTKTAHYLLFIVCHWKLHQRCTGYFSSSSVNHWGSISMNAGSKLKYIHFFVKTPHICCKIKLNEKKIRRWVFQNSFLNLTGGTKFLFLQYWKTKCCPVFLSGLFWHENITSISSSQEIFTHGIMRTDTNSFLREIQFPVEEHWQC